MGVIQNYGQHIVEVVGNAACQLADGFHFLSMSKLLVDSAALRNVAKYENCACESPLIVVDRSSADINGKFASVAADKDRVVCQSNSDAPFQYGLQWVSDRLMSLFVTNPKKGR